MLIRVTKLGPDNNGAPVKEGHVYAARGDDPKQPVWVEGQGGQLWKLWPSEYEQVRHGEAIA